MAETKPPADEGLKKKNYKIAIASFRFLDRAANTEGVSYSSLISDWVLKTTEESIHQYVPTTKRKSRGRGRTQGRKQIGLILTLEVITKINTLSTALNVWQGDILDACIIIRCQGYDAALKTNAKLLEILTDDIIPILELPQEATNVSVDGAVPRLPFLSTDIVCVDSTLMFLALTSCRAGYYQTHISPRAVQILSLIFSGKLRGVTTTLDLVELAGMLEQTDFIPEWVDARKKGNSANTTRKYEISRRIALLSASVLQIIDIDVGALVQATTSSLDTHLSLRTKIAAYSAKLSPPFKVVGCNPGYDVFSPMDVQYLQLGAFDIESTSTRDGIITGNRVMPFSEPPNLPKKKPPIHSAKRIRDAHREALLNAGTELKRLIDLIDTLDETDPRLIEHLKRIPKELNDVLSAEHTILDMMGKHTKHWHSYMPKGD